MHVVRPQGPEEIASTKWASCVAEAATYSTSIIDSTTTDNFLLYQEIACPWSKKVYAEVDLRSSRSPA